MSVTQYTYSESDGGDKSDGQLEGDKQRNLSTFTLEEEQKCARRFTEGFDLPDERYEAWQRVNHPKQLKADATKYGSNTVTKKSSSVEVSPTQSSARSTIAPQRSPLVNLLNIPVPKTSLLGTMKTGKARVLTSAECPQSFTRYRK